MHEYSEVRTEVRHEPIDPTEKPCGAVAVLFVGDLARAYPGMAIKAKDYLTADGQPVPDGVLRCSGCGRVIWIKFRKVNGLVAR